MLKRDSFGLSATPDTGDVVPRPERQICTDPFQEQKDIARDPIHLLLCINALYLQHAAVCLTSVLDNNQDLFFNIVVVGRANEVLDEEKLHRSLAGFSNHRLSLKRFTPPAAESLPLNPRAHYTVDNWTRLWVEDFFEHDVERVLYLDSDIVVVGGLASLWRTDLKGALLGTVDIPGSQHGVTKLGMRGEDGYFNSGVLLIDLKQWRQSRALETLLGYVRAHPERLVYTLDQDALNACFHSRRMRLDYRWNATWPFFQEPTSLPLARQELETIRRDARIIHFSGLKPWSYFCDHPRKAEYDKYLEMTEWRDFTPADRTLNNRVRRGISKLLPARSKSLLKSVLHRFP